MLADPQTLTINGVAHTENKIEVAGTKSIYSNSDGSVKMTVSHQASGDRIRRMVRVDQRKIAADPISSVNDYETLGVYLVIDRPIAGFSILEVDYVVQALKTWLSTATVTKVEEGQH